MATRKHVVQILQQHFVSLTSSSDSFVWIHRQVSLLAVCILFTASQPCFNCTYTSFIKLIYQTYLNNFCDNFQSFTHYHCFDMQPSLPFFMINIGTQFCILDYNNGNVQRTIPNMQQTFEFKSTQIELNATSKAKSHNGRIFD